MEDRITGYAEGILALAKAEGELERVETELFSLAQAVGSSPDLRSALTDPQLPLERKQAVVDDLLQGRASPLTLGLIQFIIGQGRASELSAIADAFVSAAAASREKAVAYVRSAVPLDEATVDRLVHALNKATGRSVEVRLIIDESIIGGLVAQVGDTVIDGSIARRVDSIRQTIGSR